MRSAGTRAEPQTSGGFVRTSLPVPRARYRSRKTTGWAAWPYTMKGMIAFVERAYSA